MTCLFSKIKNKIISFFLIASLLILWQGCDSKKNYSTKVSPVSKRITAVDVVEDDQSWNCIIVANDSLAFSAINQVSPPGILLYFPDTTLKVQYEFSGSNANKIISNVDADEFSDGRSINTRITIGLTVDRPYSISPHEKGLKISFPKKLVQPTGGQSTTFSTVRKAANNGGSSIPPATMLQSVKTTPLKNHLLVELKANGTIKDYRSFTIADPRRIVFDISKIKSHRKGGQTVVLDSKWVKQIRYNSYPNKLRLVLDMEDQVVQNYFSFPTSSGLLIYVGRLPEPLNQIYGQE